MTKKTLFGVFALLCMALFSFTSCDDDAKDKKEDAIKFSNIEIGKENSKEVVAGEDLHVEFNIVAENKIKSLVLFMADDKGKHLMEKPYTDMKYIGVKNALFHEHVDVPANISAGEYRLVVLVTDEKGNINTVNEKIKVLTKDANAPVVAIASPTEGSKLKAGSDLTVKAKITVKSAVKEIEIEFHGAKGEFPIEVKDYDGKTGTIDFVKVVKVPANAEAGEYHFHLTVTDADGRKTTGEVEGLEITK